MQSTIESVLHSATSNRRESPPDRGAGARLFGTYGMVQYDRLSVELRSGDAEGGMDFESGADRQTLGL